MAFVLLAVYVSLHLAICCSSDPDASASVASMTAVDHSTHTWHDHSRDLPCVPHAHSADDVFCTALPREKSEIAPLAALAVALPVLGLATPPAPLRTRRRRHRKSVHSGRSLLLTICIARN